MSMPTDFVEVRHGESEANLVQKARKRDPNAPTPDGFEDRHDSQMRLSPLGQWQADITGEWLRREFPAGFDRHYVSSLARTAETAGRLALNAAWYMDDRWRERDWGEYATLTGDEQQAMYARSALLKQQSKWYWCPPGGESLATGVRMRFEDILETLHRELGGRAVLAVTHGEMIEVSRAVIERLLPSEWAAQEKSPEYKLANCMIMHWSRRNPETGEISPHIEWRRAICAWDPSRSWNNGEWVHLPRPHRFSDQELLAMAEQYPPLFPQEPPKQD